MKLDIQMKNYLNVINVERHLNGNRSLIFTKGLTMGKPYTCDFCSKEFSQRSHLRTHKSFKHSEIRTEVCNVCQKTFNNKRTLKIHKHIMHATTESEFPCEVCGKTFKQDFYLKRHMKSHNSIGKYVQCSLCSKDIDKEKLKKHGKEVHQNIKEHKCSTCNMGFHRFSEMRGHIKRVHNNL